VQKAAKTLVYSNPDMMVEEKTDSAAQFKAIAPGIELPKNTLVVFRHKLTSSREDRDNDILHSDGMDVDPKMLLLWQHVHTMPIGKYLVTTSQDQKSLTVVSAVVDMNETSHDAAVMIDNDMGRFSHGFRSIEHEKRKDHRGKEVGGFEIFKAEIMEESLVSVPANIDAGTEEVLLSLVEGGKLTSPMMKEVGRSLREKRPVSVQGYSVQFREKIGDYERSIRCTSLDELKAAADAGLISTKEKNDEDRPEDRSGEGEAEAGADASKEADADGRKAKDEGPAGDEEGVKCPKCGSTNVKDGKCQDCGAVIPGESDMGKGGEPDGEKAIRGSYEQLGIDILELVKEKIKPKDAEYFYVVATFPDSIVFGVGAVTSHKQYRIAWAKDADGKIVLVGEPKEVEVREVVSTVYKDDEKSAKAKTIKCPKCGYKAPMNWWSPGKDEYLCPKCKTDVADQFPKDWMKEDEKQADPDGEKRGRVLSATNESKLKEAVEDLREAHGMELPRQAKALIKIAHDNLREVLMQLGEPKQAETGVKAMTAQEASVAFLAAAGPDDIKHLAGILQVQLEVEARKQQTKEYTRLTGSRKRLAVE